ncbi:protein of unknown function [Pseudobutyrivibrio sp. JW11]|uniref:SIR2 family protein n=1 Tax=Pseudobutyrivibrio sp. JW11 TaxID=1855302 RepID=UPI0008E3EE1D|nr:SIR2 family protein [Pseudobutyrivibrio sp. JW11]SFO64873.1 protein of unknown function [Pseudobutyrivibrio sp. JW11]
MYFNGIDFPNEIVESIKNGKLVVFAGAGASVDKPTSLPNFETLTEMIAEDTGKTLGKNDLCEVFLGALEAQGIDVRGLAAEILSGTCLDHNKLHEAIVDLFNCRDDIKIVTTNYDQMFEHVVQSRDEGIDVYNAPTLPLGDDISGVVHIHGNVNNPKYMVLTDEDFGKAYLTEGYASRFLVRLFESYTVLFIGYSYNDTILRYLTRAMSRNDSCKRYILTDDKKTDWPLLGINPIYFPKRSYAVMRDGLKKLGVGSKKGLLEWKSQFELIKDNPPRDMTGDKEIEYCLGDEEKSTLLAKAIRGKEWMDYLDRKGVFSECFSPTNSGNNSHIWAVWLCDNFVGGDDESLLELILSHKNTINPKFADEIAHRLIAIDGEIDTYYFANYILLIEKYIHNDWTLVKLIEIASNNKQWKTAFLLLKRLFVIDMTLIQKGWLVPDGVELKHSFFGGFFHVNRAWELMKKDVVIEFPRDVIFFVEEKINELHQKYDIVGQGVNNGVAIEIAMLDIENKKNSYREDQLEILANMYVESALRLHKDENAFLRQVLLNDLNSDSALMRKVALRAFRETSAFSPNEKVTFIINNEYLDNTECKEQVFLLAAKCFPQLSHAEKKDLIQAIKELDSGDKSSVSYRVYNWIVWLNRADLSDQYTHNLKEQLQNEYGYKESKHPELILSPTEVEWSHNQSPVSEEKFISLEIDKAINWLVSFNENPFEGPSREGLLNTFSACITKNVEWGKKVFEQLVKNGIWNEDIWQCGIYASMNGEYSLDDALWILRLFNKNITSIGNVSLIAEYLWKMVERSDARDFVLKYESEIFEITKNLWNARNKKEIDDLKGGRIIEATLYTALGYILLSWIYMVSFHEERIIPAQYQACFNDALSLKTTEKNVARCILVGHFNFFCYRNKDWSLDKLAPLLISNNKDCFTSSWGGIVYFSSRINSDTVDIIEPIYFKALKHIDWLDDEALRAFTELLLTLMIYVVDKPTLKYIPEYYKCISTRKRTILINTINARLRDMDASKKLEWWNSWLKRFIVNRKNNKPCILEEEENQEILDLVTVFPEQFEDVVEVVCKGKMPKKIDSSFWLQLQEMNLSSEKPHYMAKLLIRILESAEEISFSDIFIVKIVEELGPLDTKEKKELQEVLLKRNIGVEL